ncbi:PHP domain-containing protein [Halorarius halobius]|uniref:PHP domain-containing protein n=1 Tax=Halorarius halobius TaxID=2962671 RepID=UPI0020CC7F39|nr:PHP domain-containing protein [Halorarius halobius]
MTVDYHTHTNYSDGSVPMSMIRAAEEAGLDGIGFADHCVVTTDEWLQTVKRAWGFNLDATYERRREGLAALRDHADVRLFDAVEMDYKPRDESEVAVFLDDAGFDYAVGSVHELDGTNVHNEGHFVDKSDAERERLVDAYFDDLVALVESELFDVAAHLDLVERNEALRGLATESQYRRVAAALEASSTVPELNAGRVRDDDGEIHPVPGFMDVLLEYDVEFVLGSDAHEPEDIDPCVAALEKFVATHGVPTTELSL